MGVTVRAASAHELLLRISEKNGPRRVFAGPFLQVPEIATMRTQTKLAALVVAGMAALGAMAESAQAQIFVNNPYPMAGRTVYVDPGVVTTSYRTTTYAPVAPVYSTSMVSPALVPTRVTRVYEPTGATFYGPAATTVVSPALVPTTSTVVYEPQPTVVYPVVRYRRGLFGGWRAW
jgi:hypothetical protein